MEDWVPLGSREYAILLPLLLFARGMDFFSTWVATPNLVLEANPIARRLRWKWGMVVNLILCLVLAAWPLPAVIICTTSVLVAARNFQNAWLMRSYGEHNYRDWFLERLEDAHPGLFLFCLAAQTFLVAGLGGVLVFFGREQLVPLGIGIGVVAYAVAVAFYTLVALWHNRQALLRKTE